MLLYARSVARFVYLELTLYIAWSILSSGEEKSWGLPPSTI